MFGQLFIKECRQTAKSLIFWLIVLGLVLDFSTQLGGMEIMSAPVEGQEEYGYHASTDEDVIIESALGALAEEYCRKNYTTYPIGFYKSVTLSKEEDRRIGEIIREASGLDGRAEVEQTVDDWYAEQEQGETPMTSGGCRLEPAEGLTYERFIELMEEADDILGGGSKYGDGYRESNAQVPMTYEEALEEYQLLIENDRLSGGYARLFSDYMVIFLGILPVFLAATRGLRDRRAGMQELIYTRKASSLIIVSSRYLAMLAMLVIPVLALSVIPLMQCVRFGNSAGVSVDMLAFVKYTFGWLVPTIMIVLAVGMFLTELTDTAAAVLVQGAWWFISVFSGVNTLGGGMYGWNLVPRHNTELNWRGYHDGFSQLAANRIFYAVLPLALVIFTAFIYSQKRKGRFVIRGKILADRKNKLKA